MSQVYNNNLVLLENLKKLPDSTYFVYVLIFWIHLNGVNPYLLY